MANKKRLIDANALSNWLWETVDDYSWGTRQYTADDILNMLEDAPTVDAVEVEHGYWIDSTSVDHMGRIVEHGIDCSVCDSVFKDDSREIVKRWKERFKVCPFCGAIMDSDTLPMADE